MAWLVGDEGNIAAIRDENPGAGLPNLKSEDNPPMR